MSAIKPRAVTYSEFWEFRFEEIISTNVKEFISQSGLTGQELSYKTNLSLATINRLKVGKNFSIPAICALAEALDRFPEEFLLPPEHLKNSLYGINLFEE